MTMPWLQPDWPAPRGVRALATLRHGLGESLAPFDAFNLGNRHAADGDDPAVVERNRQLLVEHARLPSAPRWLRQVHGTGVLRFDGGPVRFDHARGTYECHPERSEGSAVRDESGSLTAFGTTGAASGMTRDGWGAVMEVRAANTGIASAGPAGETEPEADAAVTSTPGQVLAILTADCLPVLLCAADGSEVAGAHAGWRGLAGGVLEATLAAMHAAPSRVLAWLGPAAGPRQYEVGVEVFDAFVSQDWRAASAFTSTRPQHWRVDLYALAQRRLEGAGVPPECIFGGDLCTISEPERFFSHRRDRRTGRMASLIWIEPT